MKHILSVDQINPSELESYCKSAAYYLRNSAYQPHPHAPSGYGYQSKILANLFYEPSTRTSSSFYAAMIRLGGHVIPINNVQYSSVSKGETLEDTIRTMQCYADVIVLRHPEQGAAKRAAMVAKVPIINAGDGIGEHPTQAILDFFTIWQELSRMHYKSYAEEGFSHIHNLHVVMMGDLQRGRTVKSLAKLLRPYNVRITWVSPTDLRIPSDYLRDGEIETNEISSVIHNADVVYLTRVQHERGDRQGSDTYGITPQIMALAKKGMILMHPLPRLAELPTSLDDDPRSVYFQQMKYGMFIRMAILAHVLDAADADYRQAHYRY